MTNEELLKKEITISLTVAEVNILLQGLLELPGKSMISTFNKVQEQAQKQVQTTEKE